VVKEEKRKREEFETEYDYPKDSLIIRDKRNRTCWAIPIDVILLHFCGIELESWQKLFARISASAKAEKMAKKRRGCTSQSLKRRKQR